MAVKVKGENGALAPLPSFSDLSKGRNMALLPWYDCEFLSLAEQYGGIYNAHAHLDRAHTLEDVFLRHYNTTPLEASSLPLSVKQELVGELHVGLAYTEENLRERLSRVIDIQVALGVTRIDTNIDATPDLPEGGLLAIRVALEVKEAMEKKHADRHLKIRIAPTPIFGFKPDHKYKRTRWEVFAEACKQCDYISLLPEKDDFARGSNEDRKLDFKNHIRRGLELACDLGKEVQFHLDQMNIPGERGTERLLEVLEVLDQPVVRGSAEPTVWVIHMISPSKYPEDQYARLADNLLKHRVGVIVCPTAALSMRQLRPVKAATYNSIARLNELIKKRVPIRLGTDNIADAFVPQGDGDMLTEIKVGGVGVRLNPPVVWAKLAAGHSLNNADINTVGRYLYQDRLAWAGHADKDWRPAVE